MPKVSHDVLQQVRAAFDRYRAEVLAASLERYTERTYIQRVDQFVRWLNDEFEPGIRKKTARRRW